MTTTFLYQLNKGVDVPLKMYSMQRAHMSSFQSRESVISTIYMVQHIARHNHLYKALKAFSDLIVFKTYNHSTIPQTIKYITTLLKTTMLTTQNYKA